MIGQTTMEQTVILASQLAEFLRRVGAQWVGRNEAGGNVYRSADGTTWVIVANGDGRSVTVRRVGGSCAC